jgi:hypothetical protein
MANDIQIREYQSTQKLVHEIIQVRDAKLVQDLSILLPEAFEYCKSA